MTLRAKKNVTGPYRALKLDPRPLSEGKVVTMDAAKKMGEVFLRFDAMDVEAMSKPRDNLQHIADLKKRIVNQKDQIQEKFVLVNLDISEAVADDLPLDGGWIDEYVKFLSCGDSNFLFVVPPEASTAEDVIRYQVAAMDANLALPNPLYVAGYVPPMSPDESTHLIDAYVGSGINALIYDFRGRSLTDSSLVHLAAVAAESKKPIYIHGLQVTSYRKAKPFYTLYDLIMARVGVQSISNLRRHGGGDSTKEKKTHMKRRIKCVHGYYMPNLSELALVGKGGFSCPKCDITDIEKAIREGVAYRIHKTAIKQGAEVSYQETQVIRTEIKESSFKKHYEGKAGLKPLESSLERFENAVERERARIRERAKEEK